MLHRLETILIVTVITLLIWLFAYSQSVEPFQDSLTIRLVGPPGRDLLIEPAEPVSVLLGYRCSPALRERVRRLGVLDLEISQSEVLDLPKTIATHSRIKDLGIAVDNTQPATVSVHVEPMVKLTMSISLNVGDAQLAGPPTIEPPEASVRLPESMARLANNLQLEVRLEPQDLAHVPDNVDQPMNLRITPPALLRSQHLVIEPAVARVTFKVRKRNDTISLTSVPVLVVAPPSELARFSVQVEPDQRVLRDVVLTGPSDAIDRIRNNRFEVWAFVRLTAEDLETGVTSAPVELHVPPGVVVDSLPQGTVRFKITRTP